MNRRRVFRRMLAREAGPDADVSAIAAAARRACERLTEHLTPLIGDAGTDAICARSLQLTDRNLEWLSSAHASTPRDSRFALLQRFLEQQEPAVATETAVAVLATAADLLVSLIGESVTTSLLRETWPDDCAADTTGV